MQQPGASSVSRRATLAALVGAAVLASALVTTAPVAGAGVDPQSATVKISPTKGPPNTTIDVALTIKPADACPEIPDHPGLAVGARTPDGTVVDNDEIAPTASGVSHGTLLVPELPAGTILDIFGGCFNGNLLSPTQQFEVTESTSSPPTVTLNPTSAAPGSKVKVTAKFSEPCNTASAVLISPSTGNPVALSSFFAVNDTGNGTSTITVPGIAWPGPDYTVKVACLDPPSPSGDATLTVTGETPQAAIQISPTQGPPGTQIDVALAITPVGACPVQGSSPNVGFAARTQGQIDANSTPEDFDVVSSDAAVVHDTLAVTDLPAGTILYVFAGCIVPELNSPYVPFLVTGAGASPAPSSSSWKKKLKFHFENGLQSMLFVLIPGPQITAPTTTTTRGRPPPTTAPTLPPPPPPPSSEPSTSTTEESTSTTATTGGKP